MENNNQHINNLLKQKFEEFTPQPPDHVWKGIAAALDGDVAPVWYKTVTAKIAVALLLIVLLAGGYWVGTGSLPGNIHKPKTDTENMANQKIEMKNEHNNIQKSTISLDADKDDANQSTGQMTDKTVKSQSNKELKPNKKNVYSTKKESDNFKVTIADKPTLKINSKDYAIKTLESKSIVSSITLQPIVVMKHNNDREKPLLASTSNKQTGRWTLGFYFVPGFIFHSYDSLTIQNDYALSIEPAYYFNNNWFIRPAIGLQYTRDKGFVKANFISWDYKGSYEDVVDVTIDTSGGIYTPIYHTKTCDVFDSVRHITVSEETNKYLYLNTSVVVGYHNNIGRFGWSIFAGPAINFIIFSKQDNPVDDDATIVSLDYNLPKRKSPQYHIKIGFGLDYTIGKNWLVTVEPEYRYFINGLNGKGIYSNPVSGIGLKFGFVYTFK